MGCNKSAGIFRVPQVYTVNVLAHFEQKIVNFWLFSTKASWGANLDFFWHQGWFSGGRTTQSFPNGISIRWRNTMELHGSIYKPIQIRFLHTLHSLRKFHLLFMTSNVINWCKLILSKTGRLLQINKVFLSSKTIKFSPQSTLFFHVFLSKLLKLSISLSFLLF